MAVHQIDVPPALDARVTEALADRVERAAADPRGVIVLTGGDGTFCRGIDFAALLAADDAGTLEDECARCVNAYVRCAWQLRSCGTPVVAAVDGETLGGGVGLVAACDLVIATERSTFGLPEMLFGLIPAIALPLLLDRMSPQKARLMAMSARSYSAAEAFAMGLLDVVTPAATFQKTIKAEVRSLGRTSPDAVSALKRFGAEAEGRARLERGAETTRALLQSAAVAKAIREFMAGGPLPWEAR
jgi:enoyl-CoA hydratase/carnithine racemase